MIKIENILLKSEVLTVTSIQRKTKAQMFENLKVGDRILFSVSIIRSRKNLSTYATYITVKNLETGETTKSSFNQLPKILESFTFTEKKNWYKCDYCEHQYLVYGCESACSLNHKCEFKEKKKRIK